MPDINRDLVAEGLNKLDVTNDNHWTADGLPKVETVKLFSQGQAVTREYLNDQFPEFTRTQEASNGGSELEATQVESSALGEVPVSAGAESSGDRSEDSGEQKGSEEAQEENAPSDTEIKARAISLRNAVVVYEKACKGLDRQLLLQAIATLQSIRNEIDATIAKIEDHADRNHTESSEHISDTLAQYRASLANNPSRKSTVVVEAAKYAVDQPRTKQPLR